MVDRCIIAFIEKVRNQNENSAKTVGYYLHDFEIFCQSQTATIDKVNPACEVIQKLKQGKFNDNPKEEQPYEVLSQYASWLKRNRLDTDKNNERTVRFKLSWARTLCETNFIAISPTIFRQQVKTPKPTEPETSPIDKKAVTAIITALEDIRLQTYVMFLASMGWRATESLSITLANLEGLNVQTLKFNDSPVFVNMSGKTAKTRKGKRRQITNEIKAKIEKLLAYNYRPRILNQFDKKKNRWNHIKVKPIAKPTDKLFAPYHTDVEIRQQDTTSKKYLDNLYLSTAKRFRQATNRLGIEYEESGKRRKVTLHTFRRFVYTQCERAVGSGYAKYHTGRKTHEYSKSTDEEVAEDFASVEPYLTFLDTSAVEQSMKGIKAELTDIRKRLEKYERNDRDAEDWYKATGEVDYPREFQLDDLRKKLEKDK